MWLLAKRMPCLECVDGICLFHFERRYSSTHCWGCEMENHICVCKAILPSVNDFRKDGEFEGIKLPIAESDKIPDELLYYIFPVSSFDTLKMERIKSNNEIMKSLKYYLNYLKTQLNSSHLKTNCK